MEKIEVSKDFIKGLAQHAADTSAMFMPMSGFAMIGAAMMAKAAGEILGEEIQATEKAFLGTVRMVEAIKAPYIEELEKLRKEVEEFRMERCMKPILDKELLLKASGLLKEEIDSLKRVLEMETPDIPDEEKEEYEEEIYALEMVQELIKETVKE